MKNLVDTRVSERLEKSGASLLDKGIPFRFQLEPAIASKSRINILEEALHFPLLILKESALAYNLAAMAEWFQLLKIGMPGGKLSDHKFLFLGAGSAAIGIANLLTTTLIAQGISAAAASDRNHGRSRDSAQRRPRGWIAPR